MNLAGKIAVVTGAASGIGKVNAEMLVATGVRVVFVDANPAVQNIASVHGMHGLIGDITSSEFRHNVFHFPLVAYGEPASIGVFAAGITRDGFAIKMIDAINRGKKIKKATIFDEDKFDIVVDVNSKAPIYCAMEMFAQLSEAHQTDGARLVFIGSISSEGNMGQVNYATSKAALIGAAKTFSVEWKKLGVKVSIIHPGFTSTPMVSAMPLEVQKKIATFVESGIIHSPESVGNAILSILRDENPPNEWFLDHFNTASDWVVKHPRNAIAKPAHAS